jgi:hypothetical protein
MTADDLAELERAWAEWLEAEERIAEPNGAMDAASAAGILDSLAWRHFPALLAAAKAMATGVDGTVCGGGFVGGDPQFRLMVEVGAPWPVERHRVRVVPITEAES